MRILYVHDLYPPEMIGGGEVYAENLVTELKKRKINVMVLCGTKGKTRTEKRNGITVKRIHFRTRRELMFKTREIEKVIKEFKPDIVHTNAFTVCVPSYFAAKKHKIPVVVNLHFLFLEQYFRYHGPIKAPIFLIMERSIMKLKYDKLIALSYEIFYNLKRLDLGSKSVLIEHPINTKLFKPGKKPKKFTIGSSITLEPSKRIDLFVILARRLKANYLTAGPYTPQMKKEFDRYGIKYLGRIPHKQMPRFFNYINVYFGHGMAAKEAMACGCPTVLNEPTIRLLRYHDKELRAGVMLSGNPITIMHKLRTDKKYYNKISRKSVEFIKKNYDTDIIIPKIIKVYKELIR